MRYIGDYYHAGHHRLDDPFALMERHHIAKKQIKLLRNIDHFACLQPAVTSVELQAFTMPVKGHPFAGSHQSAPSLTKLTPEFQVVADLGGNRSKTPGR